jgi:Zn-dependent metalloprotease
MKQLLLRRLHLPLVLFTLFAIAMPAGAATPSHDLAQRTALTMLRTLTSRALNVHWSATTGTIDFLAAADPKARLTYTPSASERGNVVATAQGFLNQYRALFGLRDSRQELMLTRVEADAQLNYRHVRLGQVYRGIPVFGKQIIVHLDAQQQIVAVNGRIVPNIDVPTEPAIGAAQAEHVAIQGILEELDEHERATIKSTVLHDRTQLAIYIDSSGKPRLTWSVSLLSETPLGEWRVFVNARRPRVVHVNDSLAEAKRRVTFSADNSTDLPGRQLIDEGERSRDPIAQAAHDGAGVVYDYYQKTFQRDSIDGHGSPIVSTVHFGNDEADAENAAWVSETQQMIYGDGGRIFKPLAYGLDVIGHELTHGITDQTAQLTYEGQSGALNESYSDVFGAMIDRANWTIGEQVVKSPPFPAPFMRSLEDPNMNGLYDPNDPLSGVGQPATVNEYANLPLSRRFDNGGVHINSGIPNHAAYLVAQAIGKEKMEQIYYRTLTQYLSPESDFFAAARATVRAAQDLYGQAEVNGVRQAFAQVGIDIGGSDTVPEQPQEQPNQPGGNTPPQPQPLPAGCTDAVTNGSFEADSGWVEVSQTHIAIIDPERPHTGKRSAWLGGTDQESLQYIYQDVRIPANATSVQLSYYRQVHRELTGLLSLFAADARFSVDLTDGNGNVLSTLEELSSAQGDDTWRQAKIDLRKFAGKSVQLTFSAENPRGNVSSFFVDDVSLAVCTSGAGPAPPPAPAPSQSGVIVEGTITNVDTGRGIAGAQVFILKPGLSASDAAADDTLTRNEVLTSGVTDGNGFYQTDAAVPINQTYSVIVFASGYRPVIADDGMEVPADATSPFVVDATLRRGR